MAKNQPKSIGLKTDARSGQLSATGGINYFLRNIPLWNPPAWQEAEYWRRFVELQPIASICRDAIANYLNSLDWMIVARDSTKKDELGAQIRHYTKLFERGNAYYWDIDFSSQIEWFVKDLFTLPFGTASELGRLDDSPRGKVVWIRPLDGGTLAPTLNFDYPVVQSAPNTGINPIYLPKDFVSRVYLSPRTELRREGWGYAPPERIARAITMVSTGDEYYAKLLMDTPEAGILDLGDMDKTSATDWLKGLEDLFYGISPLKIPVLYEHEQPAKWIPFGKPPSEIMYDSVTMKYAAILTAGYGLTLSDIGFPSPSNGGDSLAGTIRMERVGKSSGKAISKKKFEAYANRILPYSLKFFFIDYDDERNVSKGRARLASAQAANINITNRTFLPSEMRRQQIADGLVSIDVPEDIDENSPEFQNLQQPVFGGNKVKEIGAKTTPSDGGQGEIIPQQILQRNMAAIEVGISKATYGVNEVLSTLTSTVKRNLSQDEIPIWEEYVDSYLTNKSDMDEQDLKSVLDGICKRSIVTLRSQKWAQEISEIIENKVILDQSLEEVNRASYIAHQKAEEDFIAGKSDDMTVADAPIVDLSEHAEDLHSVIFESLAQTASKYIVLVSKSHLFQGKLEVDPTEFKDNNISVSREISKEVMQNLSAILNSVYRDGVEYLKNKLQDKVIGEQDAIS